MDKSKLKEKMIGFHKWMLTMDTEANAEQFFHYTDEDMAEMYLDEWGPGWRDISKPLEAVPSLLDEEIMEMNQKEYERDLKVSTQDPATDNTTIDKKIGDINFMHKWIREKSGK
jgi:hypothetical protein